ncbi:putative VLTF-3-like late transcription factor [Namao virus]|nr:putative VLTF-3-like late transcription factor [Namao virus]
MEFRNLRNLDDVKKFTSVHCIHQSKLQLALKNNLELLMYQRMLKKYYKKIKKFSELHYNEYDSQVIEKKTFFDQKINHCLQKIKYIKDYTELVHYIDSSIYILNHYYTQEYLEDQDTGVIVYKDQTSSLDQISDEYNFEFFLQQHNIPYPDIVPATNPHFTKLKNKLDKYQLYQKYLKINHSALDDNHLLDTSVRQDDDPFFQFCTECNVKRLLNIYQSVLICPMCGHTEPIIIETKKQIYQDSSTMFFNKTITYKRIDYFSEILTQFQAKKNIMLSKKVMQSIKEELSKMRIYNYKEVTYQKIRKILKDLKFNKYYEYAYHITNELNGKNSPIMTSKIENQLKFIFREIQYPYNLFQPKDKTNFLSYNYILYKFCELLELDSFLSFFPLLKSRDKLEEQDSIWKKICEYKNFQFIPSI